MMEKRKLEHFEEEDSESDREVDEGGEPPLKLKKGIQDPAVLRNRAETQMNQVRKQKKLPQFDYDKIKTLDLFLIVFGKRRYGKTTWTRYLLSKLWIYFPRGGYVFTKTKHNYFWQQHFPETRIYDNFDEDVIRKILTEQKTIYEQFLDNTQPPGCVPYIVLIFDDMISGATLRYEKLLDELVYSGRHYFLFVVVCSQDTKGLPPSLRANSDLIVTTYQTQERNIDTIQKDYADLMTDDSFKELLQFNTTDHHVVLIDQTEAKYSMEDVFFTDEAEPDPEPFRIGDDEFWALSGCDWKKQLKKADNKKKNLDNMDKEAWLKRAKQKALKAKSDFKGSTWQLETNQIGLAEKSTQNTYQVALRKKYGLDKGSHVQNGFKSVEKVFKYIPGPPGTLKF
jgi:hypothetical protein